MRTVGRSGVTAGTAVGLRTRVGRTAAREARTACDARDVLVRVDVWCVVDVCDGDVCDAGDGR